MRGQREPGLANHIGAALCRLGNEKSPPVFLFFADVYLISWKMLLFNYSYLYFYVFYLVSESCDVLTALTHSLTQRSELGINN